MNFDRDFRSLGYHLLCVKSDLSCLNNKINEEVDECLKENKGWNLELDHFSQHTVDELENFWNSFFKFKKKIKNAIKNDLKHEKIVDKNKNTRHNHWENKYKSVYVFDKDCRTCRFIKKLGLLEELDLKKEEDNERYGL